MNRRFPQTSLRIVADQRSAPTTLVVRDRPKEDESYLGFLLRLTELNAYDTTRWVLQGARMPLGLAGGGLVARIEVDLPSLAEATKLDITDLRPLAYDPVTYRYQGPVLGSSRPPHVLRLRRPKVCPECLRQANYCRKQWDYLAVTACPIHHVMLLEDCPACRNPIAWLRKSVSTCRCGADWRDTQVAGLSESDTIVSTVLYQILAPLSRSKHNGETSNPLYNVDLSSFLGALFFVSIHQRDPDTVHSFPQMNILEIHEVMLKAFSVFEFWPTNFHRFLEQHCSRSRLSKSTNGLLNRFGSFGRQLYRVSYLPTKIAQILQHEFERYVFENWDEGYVSAPRWFRLRQADKYVSRQKAATILNVDPCTIEGLISDGNLKGTVLRKGSKQRVFLVEAQSVENYKGRCCGSLSLRAASQILGLTQANISRLVENSLLASTNGTRSGPAYRFDETTVNGLLRNVLSKPLKSTSPVNSGLRDFGNVLERLTVRLASTRWGIDTFIKDILSGLIRPSAEWPDEIGFRRLRFSQRDVAQYQKKKLTYEPKQRFTIAANPAALEFRARALYFLASKGLIGTKSGTKKGVKVKIITREALLVFQSNYVTARAVARETGTSIEFVVPALISRGVRPVSGISVDGGPLYIFKREDIEKFRLKDIKALPRKGRKYRLSHPVDSAEAAKILSLRKRDILTLVANDVLRPYRDSFRSDGEYRFNPTYVEGFKDQFGILTDLVSTRAAARLLNVGLPAFTSSWIKTGYLKYQVSKNGKKQFLSRHDVENLSSFLKAVVNEKDASRLLGVTTNYVQKLAERKLITLLNNPYPRMFKSRIYSKAELVNLRVIKHKNRSYRKTLVRINPGLPKRDGAVSFPTPTNQ